MELFLHVHMGRDLVLTNESKDSHIKYSIHDIKNNHSFVILDSEDYEKTGDNALKQANNIASQNLVISKTHTDWQVLLDLIKDAFELEEKRFQTFEALYAHTENLKIIRQENYDYMLKEMERYKSYIIEKYHLYLSANNTHENEYDYDNLHLTMTKPSK